MGQNIGKVGLSPQGKYESGRTYVRLMTVSHNGNYWVAVKDVPANAAPYDGSAYWHIMAEKGIQGPQGQSYVDREMVPIVDNLTQGGSANVLSAEQGKILKQELTELESEVKDSVANIKPIIINGNVTNAPDEEDITSDDNLLKLKDRVVLNGMGYIILRKNKSLSSQLTQQNTIYEIRYDFDLQGEAISIPDKCVLFFNGGEINGASLTFSNTKIDNANFKNCRFFGSVCNHKFNIEDYGAVRKSGDCSQLINDIAKLKMSGYGSKTIYIPSGVWDISSPIVLFGGYDEAINIIGDGYSSVIRQMTDNEYIIKKYEVSNVANLSLMYANQQTSENTRSIAVAVGRSIMSSWRNILIRNAYDGFGYIKSADYDEGVPSTAGAFCYVNDTFDNIRCHRCANYAFDFGNKEISQADSGSYYANIYINSGDPYTGELYECKGGIRAVSTNAVFSQLNIEGAGFTSNLIKNEGYSALGISFLHIEAVNPTQPLIYTLNNATTKVAIVELQTVNFSGNYMKAFTQSGGGYVDLGIIKLRGCSKADGLSVYMCANETNDGFIHIANIIYNETSTSLFGAIVNQPSNGRYSVLDDKVLLTSLADLDYRFTSRFGKSRLFEFVKSDESIDYLCYANSSEQRRAVMTHPVVDSNGAIVRTAGYNGAIPKLGDTFIGFCFFDRNTNKPIWYKGGDEWVDATGTKVY